MPLFALLFIALPIIEISVFIQVGSALGVLATLLLTIATSVLGVAVMRHQQWSKVMQIQQQLRMGESPALAMVDGVLLAFAGGCLILPGFFTDAIGLLLLIPSLRLALIEKGISKMVKPSSGASFHHFEFRSHTQQQGRTFDAEFEYKNSEQSHYLSNDKESDQDK